ncbi:MAG: permease-like cell division protein FtsX [Clostridia bacterium]|nr:permease-like cell division protein FtsX [Clostridia bacterium]
MKRYSLFYFIGQAFRGLWRNGVMSFASIAILMSCLVVIGGFTLLVYNIDVNLEDFGLQNEIIVYLNFDLEEEAIVAIGDKLDSLDHVESVTRTTKSQALQQMKQEYEVYADVTEEENPLSDSFTIIYQENEKVPELKYQIQQIEGYRKLSDKADLASTLESFKNGIMLIFIWFLAILVVVSVFIIVNTIKLSVFARRHEISVMRYVGATGWFITLPFVIEGIIIGLVSSITAYFVEWYFYSYIETMATEDMKMITIASFDSIYLYVLIGFIGLGVLTGIIGSSISLGKYLKQ